MSKPMFKRQELLHILATLHSALDKADNVTEVGVSVKRITDKPDSFAVSIRGKDMFFQNVAKSEDLTTAEALDNFIAATEQQKEAL